jgi:hypothetical protein
LSHHAFQLQGAFGERMGIRGRSVRSERGGGGRGNYRDVLMTCRFVSSRGICVNRAWIRGDIDETGRSILSISSRGPEHKTWGRAAVRRDTLESFLTDCVFYIGPYCGHVFFVCKARARRSGMGPAGVLGLRTWWPRALTRGFVRQARRRHYHVLVALSFGGHGGMCILLQTCVYRLVRCRFWMGNRTVQFAASAQICSALEGPRPGSSRVSRSVALQTSNFAGGCSGLDRAMTAVTDLGVRLLWRAG